MTFVPGVVCYKTCVRMSETIASSDTGQGQGADAPSSGERVKRDSLVLYGSMIDVQGTGDNGSDKEPEGSDSKIGDSDASAMLAQGDELSASSVGTDESNGDAPGEAAAASEGEEGESTGESREEKPDGGASDSDANAGVEMKDSRAGGERTWRVKLYQLREEDGQWADKGTGNVAVVDPGAPPFFSTSANQRRARDALAASGSFTSAHSVSGCPVPGHCRGPTLVVVFCWFHATKSETLPPRPLGTRAASSPRERRRALGVALVGAH